MLSLGFDSLFTASALGWVTFWCGQFFWAFEVFLDVGWCVWFGCH